MGSSVIECGINFLSYDHACKVVPPEYLYAYEWFQDNKGQVEWLPMGKHSPKLPVKITLARQSGIHTPAYGSLESKGAGRKRYALLIHSEGSFASSNSPYPDRDIIERPDGTWTFDYCAHRPVFGNKTNQNYNSDLMNNLHDGVPVAVFIRRPNGGYNNYGLAYVEKYDPIADMFTLHGPVSTETNSVDFCSVIPFDLLTDEEKRIFKSADAGDERKKVLAEQVRREKQQEFRHSLLVAYSGSCAATGVDVPEALQAAHIDRYWGRYSQQAPSGILLRADIHLLYDACLLTVLPEKNTMRVSKRIAHSLYAQLDGRKIRVPDNPLARPDDELLEMHMRRFEHAERQLLAI